MKIIDIITGDKPSLSFEVFPPKTSDAFDSVKTATEEIALLSPSYMSVTYGAGGGTSEFTVNIAENLEKNCGVPALAHLSCVSSTKAEIKAQLDTLREKGIENILALRGDIPKELEDADNVFKVYATYFANENIVNKKTETILLIDKRMEDYLKEEFHLVEIKEVI